MGIGMMLSKLIDISSISHLAPVFAVLTFMNLTMSYCSARMIDEIYLNNQRAGLLFDEFMASDLEQVPSMKSINRKVNFLLPKLVNRQHSRFIRFGEKSVSDVIGGSNKHYYLTSFLHQLHKEDRNFVYYIEMLPQWKRNFKSFSNNGRPYIIHINMKKRRTNEDQLEAYYFARLLDR